MKPFLYSLLTITIGLILLFAITLLLDTQFIQAHTIRQLLVYTIMVVIGFLVFRLVVLINK